MSMIEIKGLTKHFGKHVAVDGMDLSIEKGELFGLLGVNGAGKTTAIRMLSCLTAPTAGDALLNGHSIRTDAAGVKASIGISPQTTAVAPNLTVRENLDFMARVYGRTAAEAAARAEEIIQQYGLSEVAERRAKVLSGGWQRRLSIAMAVIADPPILFLDEPTLGLDVLARRELWRAIEQMKGNTTVILTTHYLEEAEALCDRIAIMTMGHIRATGTADELKALAGASNFEDAFVHIAEGGLS